MRRLALILALAATPARADTWVTFDRPVDDRSFYRAVACAAPAGARCTDPLTRWSARDRRDLTVSLRLMDEGPRTPRRAAMSQAIDHAIREINATGADLRLVRVRDGLDAMIDVWDSRFREGDPIVMPSEDLRGEALMEGARVQVWWDGDFTLTRAVILIAADLGTPDLRSVVLEEMVQSLGLLTDIEGEAYAETSIFSESSNAVTRLRGQDATAIRLHYPRD